MGGEDPKDPDVEFIGLMPVAPAILLVELLLPHPLLSPLHPLQLPLHPLLQHPLLLPQPQLVLIAEFVLRTKEPSLPRQILRRVTSAILKYFQRVFVSTGITIRFPYSLKFFKRLPGALLTSILFCQVKMNIARLVSRQRLQEQINASAQPLRMGGLQLPFYSRLNALRNSLMLFSILFDQSASQRSPLIGLRIRLTLFSMLFFYISRYYFY
jgi:hypothetical protein